MIDVGITPAIRPLPITVDKRPDMYSFADDLVVRVDMLRCNPRRVDDEIVVLVLGIDTESEHDNRHTFDRDNRAIATPKGRLEPAAHADAVILAIESRCEALGVAPSLFRDAATHVAEIAVQRRA